MDVTYPPFQETFKALFKDSSPKENKRRISMDGECVLPLIDMKLLTLGDSERDRFVKEMAQAARSWGIFQVVNHGVPPEALQSLFHEQMEVFHVPFHKKAQENFLNFSANSYRWGNPRATCVTQFSWSEAFHIPFTDIVKLDENRITLRSTVQLFAEAAASLAQRLAKMLTQNLGVNPTFFQENCTPGTGYVRMNRYLPCPLSCETYGLLPHTDSDFLTIVRQDQVGGLQVMKDGRWLDVRSNPEALIVFIGDLFQAFSNDSYRSIKHRVLAPQKVERFSVAYFCCPSNDTLISSCLKPAIYRDFSFGEYRQQIQRDVDSIGDKIGLPRFLS